MDENLSAAEQEALNRMSIAAEGFIDAHARKDYDGAEMWADNMELARIDFRRAERNRRRRERKNDTTT